RLVVSCAFLVLLTCARARRALHSFPTRRSSDLEVTDAAPVAARALVKRYGKLVAVDNVDLTVERGDVFGYLGPNGAGKTTSLRIDRKSTRLNSSHGSISYAVFCLKKKRNAEAPP